MDKGIFAYGYPFTAVSNLISNTGVMAADVSGVGVTKGYGSACGYN